MKDLLKKTLLIIVMVSLHGLLQIKEAQCGCDPSQGQYPPPEYAISVACDLVEYWQAGPGGYQQFLMGVYADENEAMAACEAMAGCNTCNRVYSKAYVHDGDVSDMNLSFGIIISTV